MRVLKRAAEQAVERLDLGMKAATSIAQQAFDEQMRAEEARDAALLRVPALEEALRNAGFSRANCTAMRT